MCVDGYVLHVCIRIYTYITSRVMGMPSQQDIKKRRIHTQKLAASQASHQRQPPSKKRKIVVRTAKGFIALLIVLLLLLPLLAGLLPAPAPS